MGLLLTGAGRGAAVSTSLITLRDARTCRLTTATGDLDLSFSTGLNPGQLDFLSGNLLLVLGYLRHQGTTGTSAVVTEGAATGWTKFGFGQNPPGLQHAGGIIGAFKVSNGTETTVDLLNGAGAAGTISNFGRYHGFSFDITGVPALGAINNGQVTHLAPDTQVIAAGGGSPPLIAFSFAAAEGEPDQSFATQTPDSSLGEGTFGVFSRSKIKIFNSAPADITTAYPDKINLNGLLSGYIEVA